MNKIKLIVVAIFMSASTAVIAAEGFQLVSETEYREQISFARPYVKTRGFNASPKGSPKISIDKPSILGTVSSPTNIEISFKADDGAEIDVESLEVLYGWLSLNITDRIREHAKLSTEGLKG